MGTTDDIVTNTAAEHDFSGVVRVDDGAGVHEWAFGMADRRHRIANTTDTRFSLASGTKGFTALAVMSLVESGKLALDLPVRAVLGDDLALIDERVTIEHLLAHRSGIGDYLDEAELTDIDDYAMPVPVQDLSGTERYLPILDGHPQVFTPGERFSYNNSGFVVLALVAERGLRSALRIPGGRARLHPSRDDEHRLPAFGSTAARCGDRLPLPRTPADEHLPSAGDGQR